MKKILLSTLALSIGLIPTFANAATHGVSRINYTVEVIDGHTHLTGEQIATRIAQLTGASLTSKPHEDVNVVNDDAIDVKNQLETILNTPASSEKIFENIKEGQTIHVSSFKPRLTVEPSDSEDEEQYVDKKMKYSASGRVKSDLVDLHFDSSLNGQVKKGHYNVPNGATIVISFNSDPNDKTSKEIILLSPEIQ